MTKSLTFKYILILLLLSSCWISDDDPKIVTLNCEAFDFQLPEMEWILFPDEIESTFTHENDTIKLNSNFVSSEPYILEYEKRFRLFPDGQVRDCFAYYDSEHISQDGAIRIANSISYRNNKENLRFRLLFNTLRINLLVESDSLKIDVPSISIDEIEFFTLKNYDSAEFGGITYPNLAIIKYDNPSGEFQEVIVAKNLGLLAFRKNDTLWTRKQ